MEKMRKQRNWTVLSVIGLLILILFAVICIAPFVYMVFMSFTQSTTLMLHLEDVNLRISPILSMCWAETDSSGP